jgi:hypothetical protein
LLAALFTELNMTIFVPERDNHEGNFNRKEIAVVIIGVTVILLGLILMAVILPSAGVVPGL